MAKTWLNRSNSTFRFRTGQITGSPQKLWPLTPEGHKGRFLSRGPKKELGRNFIHRLRRLARIGSHFSFPNWVIHWVRCVCHQQNVWTISRWFYQKGRITGLGSTALYVSSQSSAHLDRSRTWLVIAPPNSEGPNSIPMYLHYTTEFGLEKRL